ncbi:ras-related protein Rab-31 isoform X1 [Neodiprion pinetum]|uniref:ras-related protein Rab-31 isoform X1 n=2 Tax=Neodiprion pinetum TaxID=441929 RepID=UPI001EE01B45|nr:ras-related protein Rab-31 isoform X1 [Neodiprion pinetum]
MKTIEGKVVILGAQGVGKTMVICRYITKMFNRRISPTIGAAFYTCNINLERVKVKLQIWDTAGQERFRSMAPMYYRNANVALLVFDLTKHSSFNEIKSWVVELKRNVDKTMVLVLVGNKSDLVSQRTVDAEEASQYATSIGASYHETSAVCDDGGVESVFVAAAAGLYDLSEENHERLNSLRINDSIRSILNSDDQPASPSSEDCCLADRSIAHGIHEKPHMCC